MILTGCSGWYYNHWVGNEKFYPEDLSKKEWLKFYAEHFDSVEVNSTFYNFPREGMLNGWRKRTPPNFVFTLKANRLITHERKLKGVEDLLNSFYSRAEILEEKLGAVLFQTPPSLKKDLDLLENFLAHLQAEKDNVVEFRHRSWYSEEVFQLLRESGVGFCIPSCPDFPSKVEITSDLAYLRLHGEEQWYRSPYSQEDLKEWAGQIRKMEERVEKVYVYFNNDFGCHAPRNAKQLKEILK